MAHINELALFAGAGGGILASKLLGWDTVAACEIEEYPRNVLLQRQRDGILEPFPIWDDIRTFDGRPWRNKVNLISGGFPCQDISAAGKGAGITGERSGLWSEMFRVVEEIRPEFVFAENSPVLRTRGLGTVIKDLASLGYDVRWCVLGAWHVGANHKRNRMWVLAHAKGECGRAGLCKNASQSDGDIAADCSGTVADTYEVRLEGQRSHDDPKGRETSRGSTGLRSGAEPRWNPYAPPWQSEPDVGRVANGVAKRVDRIKAIGNGQVPAVAATAFRILSDGLI